MFFLYYHVTIVVAIAKKQIEIQTPLNYLRELRNKKMSELISNIKVLKLFYWEKLFSDTISDIRSGTSHYTHLHPYQTSDELTTLEKALLVRCLSLFAWAMTPLLVTVVTFASYVWNGYDITPDRAFTALGDYASTLIPIDWLTVNFSTV